MKFKFIVSSLLALFFSACEAPAPSTAQPSPTIPALPDTEVPFAPEPTQPPVQAEPLPTGETPPTAAIAITTYTDEFAGFTLDYPANWYLESSALMHAEESFGYNVSIATWDILNPPTPSGKGQNGLPEGGTKIDIAVTKQALTLEEAVAQQEQNESGSPILNREDVTLASGIPAVILDFEGPFGLIRTLITVLNGNIIYVSGYGNLEPFEAIALSLRPN